MQISSSRCLFLPPLYRKTAKGELQKWRVWSIGRKVFTEFGLVDGKKQKTVGKKCEPTNEGRSNARTGTEQAQFEALAMWKHRRQRKYRDSLEQAKKEVILFPMLALDFWRRRKKQEKRELSAAAKKLHFPIYVQRKYNGLRCLARWTSKGIVLFSRQGKIYEVPHITEALSKSFPKEWSIMLDGELYVHGLPLQKINSLVKDYREESKVIEFHIYDLYNLDSPEASQRQRFHWLDEFFSLPHTPAFYGKVVQAPRHRACSYYEVMEFERRFVAEGFEGAIGRSMRGKYRLGARSADLLKYKTFEDAEFKVIGVKEGKGKFEGCAIFVCRNDKNRETFKVTPKGDAIERRSFWKNRRSFIGKKYTVRFMGRTEDLKPFNPIGIAFRDRKDLP